VTDRITLEGFLAGVERRAFRMAQYAVRDRDDAMDIVQDAMLLLASRYADRPADEWRPLFFRILRNRITDHHRRTAVRRRLFGLLGGDPDESASDVVDRVAGDAGIEPEQATRLRAALVRLEAVVRELPARQREALLLRVWEGLDVADTAVAMGCSEGSVKTHLSRAVHRLREALSEDWP
jgi:RNA polymerase sigma-70 factor (ECF subfamily)